MKRLTVTTFFSFLIVLPSRGQVDVENSKLERLEENIIFESERDAPAGASRFIGHGRTEIYVFICTENCPGICIENCPTLRA